MFRKLTPMLALLFSSSAFALQGDGVPVSPSPFVEVQIDEAHACDPAESVKGASKPPQAEELCDDFNKAASFRKPSETAIQNARKLCVDFYRNALRLQNVFCSYRKDVARTEATIQDTTQKAEVAEIIGEQTKSQNLVAGVNRIAAGLNQKYMVRIAKVASEFRASYPKYTAALGKLNGGGGTDVAREANCLGQPKGTNLDLSSNVPGHLRELLATVSHATAFTTYNSVMDYTRYNYGLLREAKEKAQANAEKADLNSNLAVPTLFADAISKGGALGDGREPLSPSEGAMYGAFQDLITRGIKAKFAAQFPILAGPVGSIVGGGIVLAWQYESNKRIMYPETIATFVGMINPYAGMAANMLVGAYRTSQARISEYQQFTMNALKGQVNLATIGPDGNFTETRAPGTIEASAAQLVEAWGQFKKNQACIDSAKMEAHCVAIRPTLPAYSGSNCAPSSVDRAYQRQSDITR